MRIRASTWRVGTLAFLFPALLLLPTLHSHPAYEHAHGTHEAHRHVSVVHADFLSFSTHDHDEHHRGHGVPGGPSAEPLFQINFPTLLPRSPVLSPPALEKVFFSLPTAVLIVASPFSFYRRLLARDHSPPAQAHHLFPLSPRSPPRLA